MHNAIIVTAQYDMTVSSGSHLFDISGQTKLVTSFTPTSPQANGPDGEFFISGHFGVFSIAADYWRDLKAQKGEPRHYFEATTFETFSVTPIGFDSDVVRKRMVRKRASSRSELDPHSAARFSSGDFWAE